jgi:hypothetical protein
MRIYVAHSNNYDFKSELYSVLRRSELNNKYTILLPHETDVFINTKQIIMGSDVIVAEVSYPATGEGIELGWASDANKRIICVYKSGSKPSSSLKVVSDTFIEYASPTELIDKLLNVL